MKHRRDHNQLEIIKAFETMGCSVFDLSHVGGGMCDLLVGLVGINLLVEVKKPRGTLTPAQTDFFLEWRGQKVIITNQGEAVDLVDRYRSGIKNLKRLPGLGAAGHLKNRERGF